MPSLFACLGCGGGAESDDIRVLDYCHCSLTDVPSDVFASERTLEELHLDSNQLSELPRQLFYCHGLKELGLSDNELTSLPPAVASLINLNSIDLSKNAISDIPDNIKGCKQLSVVDASINPLCRLPEGFTQLLSLQELYLNDTFLEYLPANFGRLSRLRILELRENQLNTLPKSMARLTNLQRLDIGQNDFSDLPGVIVSLENLTELWFDNNKIKCLPPLLGKLKKLVHVDGSKNKIDWVAEEMEHCAQLTDLYLSSNNLKELPEKFGSCRQLRVLKLDDNALTHLPESIGGLVSLEELVVTLNDLKNLPASIGLLRGLHTLHVDDNLLEELPSELGSCSRLTVLTAASNRLTAVPAEIGHLPQLAVLNLCDNLIHHLPVSLTKLKLRALWLSENQNKPQVQLQSETLQETGQRVLTCFMLPQQQRPYNPEVVDEADTFPGQGWDEQRKAKTLIKFAFDGDVDKPGRLTRAPTPYPKELKALAKHARNLSSLQKDASRQFVLGHSKDSNAKVSASSVVSPSKEELEMDTLSKETKAELKQPLLLTNNTNSDKSFSTEDPKELEDTSLTVVEPQLEERPLLREARNVKNTPMSNAANSGNHDAIDTSLNDMKTNNNPEQIYAIGDRKVFGHAQVVTVNQTSDKAGNETYANIPPRIDDASSNGMNKVSSPSQMSTSVQEVEPQTESPDKRIKKPPPYHIAAVMSRHAADFQEASVEVPSSPTGTMAGMGLTVKELPSPLAEISGVDNKLGTEENADNKSCSDSGYGISKNSSSQDYVNISSASASSPMSPQNTDSNFTMPSTPTSPLSPSSPGVMSDQRHFGSPYSPATSIGSPLSPGMYKAGDRHSHAGIQQSKPTSPLYSSQQLFSSQVSSYSRNQQPYGRDSRDLTYTTPHARPASIATGAQFDKQISGGLNTQRPGSLALGPLADSALLNRRPQDQRPGSLAAPINTVGIPPAPTRAMSYMGLNVSSPTKQRDPHMYRSHDMLGGPSNHNSGEYQQGFGRTNDQQQESNGLVSIIDQVTSSILEHGESPPPKVSISATSPPSTHLVTSTISSSLHYSEPSSNVSVANNITVSVPQMTPTESSSSNSVSGLTNFTQDQPQGEVLHPTPHRPHMMLSSTMNQDGDESTSHVEESLPPVSSEEVSPPKTAPKPISRIPSLKSEVQSGLNNNKYESHHQSSHGYNHTESQMPNLDGRRGSSTPSTNEYNVESKIPSLGSSGRSSSSLSQESKGLYESLIPSSRPTIATSNTIQTKVGLGESRIPMSGNNITGMDKTLNNPPTSQDTQKPYLANTGRTPSTWSQDNQTTTESRIPLMPGMVRSSSNLGRENSSTSLGSGGSKLPTLGSYSSPSSTNLVSGIPSIPQSNSPSGIPSLASQGRSNSGLGSSSIPVPASFSPRGETPKNPANDHSQQRSLSKLSSNQVTSSSRLPSPGYASGIRPPGMRTSSPLLSGKSPHASSPLVSSGKSPQTTPYQGSSQLSSPSGYGSGIRPPSINAAINTPGIPLPSSIPSASHLNNPGSRSSVSSTGSGSRIPMTSGHSASRLPAPSSSRIPGSYQSGLTTDNSKNNSSWMFGQHKNARVFPVVIEKNPDLGFTVGLSEHDPDDKSVYVTSVAGGGSASSALKVGDKLLQVDGSDVRSADLRTATLILNKTSQTVNLMVSRVQ